jgi:DNA primase
MRDLEQENLYYRKALRHPEHGQVGRAYLAKRGINFETIDKWEIGWSPYGCIPTNFSDWKEDYKPWPKLWGRITFPIRDQNGKMISISGRLVLDLKDRPKYDHYPFNARKILFGLWQNREDIRLNDRIIITEGQIDVITSWQEGLRIVASSFGAHCSLDHFAIASRFASTVDILYDEDAAGKNGTDAIQEFPTWGDLKVNLRRGIFPKGDDLDSWIKKHSVEELFILINKNKNDELKQKLAQMRKGS